MPIPHSPKITVFEEVYPILQRIIKSPKSERRFYQRAMFILRMSQGKPNTKIAREFGVQTKTVKKWRYRWLEGEEILREMIDQKRNIKEFEKVLTEQVEMVLSDGERIGRPPTYTPEQYCQVLEVALEKPVRSGRAINRWTNRELADEVNKRGICEKISKTQVGRFLKRSRPQTASDQLLDELD